MDEFEFDLELTNGTKKTLGFSKSFGKLMNKLWSYFTILNHSYSASPEKLSTHGLLYGNNIDLIL